MGGLPADFRSTGSQKSACVVVNQDVPVLVSHNQSCLLFIDGQTVFTPYVNLKYSHRVFKMVKETMYNGPVNWVPLTTSSVTQRTQIQRAIIFSVKNASSTLQ